MNLDSILEQFNDKNAQNSFNPADVQKNNVVVMLGYIFPILFFLPICVDGKSNYCRFHANQQLTWFITSIILGIVMGIFVFIPILGMIVSMLISLVDILMIIFLAIGAYKGKAVRIPLVGNFLHVFFN